MPPIGSWICAALLFPQQYTWPARMPQTWLLPTETCVHSRSVPICCAMPRFVTPSVESSPQHHSDVSAPIAHVAPPPALSAVNEGAVVGTTTSVGGGVPPLAPSTW